MYDIQCSYIGVYMTLCTYMWPGSLLLCSYMNISANSKLIPHYHCMILVYLPIVGLVIYLVILLSRKVRRQKKPRASSAYTVVSVPRSTVTSTDLDELLDGPEEFPARMLYAEYDHYEGTQSIDLSTPGPLSQSDDMFTESS